jgi:5-deoxy-D-glucuronate isomerase
VRVADARVASDKPLQPRVIRPQDCGYEIRGGGNATRQIVDIIPPSFAADRLLVCECSRRAATGVYPPHKHDTDDLPREVDLQEVTISVFRIRTDMAFSASIASGAMKRCAYAATSWPYVRLSSFCYSLWVRCTT